MNSALADNDSIPPACTVILFENLEESGHFHNWCELKSLTHCCQGIFYFVFVCYQTHFDRMPTTGNDQPKCMTFIKCLPVNNGHQQASRIATVRSKKQGNLQVNRALLLAHVNEFVRSLIHTKGGAPGDAASQ